MLAFEVEVDGKPLATTGIEDWAVLTCIVSANRARGQGGAAIDDLSLHLGGLTLRNDEGVSHHVRWGKAHNLLAIGSHVGLRIVDIDATDAPTVRNRSDREVQEHAFTEEEMREMRYQDYLELKKEFESDSAG
jgi:hypothetical protein